MVSTPSPPTSSSILFLSHISSLRIPLSLASLPPSLSPFLHKPMSISSSSTTTDPSIAGMSDINPYMTAAKRRRTRRRRLHELHPPTPSCSSSTSSSPRDHEKITHDVERMEDNDVEEEDNYMAYCLMLLSRGRAPSTEMDAASAVAPSVGVAAAAGTRLGEVETGVYRCKTCNKAFSSFQALGGHRTSHTKVKQPPSVPVGPTTATSSSANYNNSSSAAAEAVAIEVFPPKPRVHACSTCGAEFTSGQALGGHMRRHRPVTGCTSAVRDAFVEAEEDKAVMLLDLNAPPPPQLGASEFAFAADDPPPLPFSALVDCHY